MRRWLVEVPKPSAKRLEKNRKVVVQGSDMGGGFRREWPIPDGEDLVQFDCDYPFEERDPDVLDGHVYYQTYIEYQNSTGSRKETIYVKPELVEEWGEETRSVGA